MTMNTMLRAAIMVVSIGTSSAYACDGDYSATRLLTSIPSEQSSLAVAAPGRGVTVQVDGVARSYATTSRRGAWLFLSAPDRGEP
jgi:hypothetical protein